MVCTTGLFDDTCIASECNYYAITLKIKVAPKFNTLSELF